MPTAIPQGESSPNRALFDFLVERNRGQSRLFNEWINGLTEPIGLCWQPYAGHDWSDLLYFSQEYIDTVFMPDGCSVVAPKLFIHTDAGMQMRGALCEAQHLLPLKFPNDGRTKLVSCETEQLFTLNIQPPGEKEEVRLQGVSREYGKVVFLKLKIESDRLGLLEQQVIYSFAENTAFFEEILRRYDAKVGWIWISGLTACNRPDNWLEAAANELRTKLIYSLDYVPNGWVNPNNKFGEPMDKWFVHVGA